MVITVSLKLRCKVALMPTEGSQQASGDKPCRRPRNKTITESLPLFSSWNYFFVFFELGGQLVQPGRGGDVRKYELRENQRKLRPSHDLVKQLH